MSQAGIINILNNNPSIPTQFNANSGFAVPVGNQLNVFGDNTQGITTTGLGMTLTIAGIDAAYVQKGVASFDSGDFTVVNGHVTLNGTGAGQTITGQSGGALSPTAGNWNIYGASTAAGTNPVTTSGAVSTLTVNVQKTQAIAATDATKVGLASFDSTAFDVDANGFVQLNGGGIATTSFDVQANTAPGVDPVVPTAAGAVTVNGLAVANHSVVIETRSRALNAYNIEVQYATSAAATDATKSGVAHFDSAVFTVDANGFVTLAGGSLAIDSIGVDATSGGTNPVLPTAGGLVTVNGARVAAGTNPIRTVSTAVNVYQIQVQTTQAIASTDATKVGLAAFDSTDFSVDANGFVALAGSGAGQTITGDTGGVLTPTGGNWNILGAHGINTSGAVSTLTVAINNAITLGDLSALGSGVNALSATTGDINLTAGNLKLPDANAGLTQGQIIWTNNTRIHNFGTNNFFAGIGAGNTTMTGQRNYGIGRNNFSSVTSGSDNVAIGHLNSDALTSASNNTAVGNFALGGITSGSGTNTAIGKDSYINLATGNNNVGLGYNTGSAYTTTEANNITIGSGVTGTIGESGVTRIGASQTACYIDGIDGVNVGSVATVVTESGDRLGTAVITAGTGVGVTPGANTITISASATTPLSFPTDSGTATPAANALSILGGPGVTTSGSGSTVTINSVVFTDQGGSTTVTSDSGSFATAAITLTLPASPAQGELLHFVCTTANALVVDAPSTHLIRIGSLVTSAGGTATSTAIGDSLTLRYRTSDTTWYATSVIGIWLIA